MTESSRFWNTNGIGDGAETGFDRQAIASWARQVFGRGEDGILKTVDDMLVVSGSSSPLSLAPGAALIDGIYYENTAPLDLTVTTPNVGTTGGQVILRADWTAQTVRAEVLLNTDGNSDIPALTQTRGATFEFGLATFQIQTDGTIVDLTNVSSPIILPGLSVIGNPSVNRWFGDILIATSAGQVLQRSGTELGFRKMATGGFVDGAITNAKLANNAIDDTKAGVRLPQFYRRQGGDAGNWNSPGITNYSPGKVIVQAGVYRVTKMFNPQNSFVIDMPVAVEHPLVFLTLNRVYDSFNHDQYAIFGFALSSRVEGEDLDPGQIEITATHYYGKTYNFTLDITWLAIGPEA